MSRSSGAHLVVHDDAALDRQTTTRSNLPIRLDARRDHDHVAIECAAIGESQARARGLRQGLPWCSFQVDFDAQLLHADLENGSSRGIELLFHQVTAQMDDVHFQTEVLKTPGCFQSEQSAADHRGAAFALGVRGNLAAIVQECGIQTRPA